MRRIEKPCFAKSSVYGAKMRSFATKPNMPPRRSRRRARRSPTWNVNWRRESEIRRIPPNPHRRTAWPGNPARVDANVDETGWRTNKEKRFLRAFVAARFVLFTIAKTRGSELLIQILGAVFEGILCSDRFSGYLKHHKGKAQFCWAHLKRNILGVLDFTKETAAEQFCRDALAAHASLFRLWDKFRSGLIDRPQLLNRSVRLQKRLFILAENNLDSPDGQVQNLAWALFEHSERLFTFLEHAGVEPTNNSAERALRTGVQWRKICFGNRSADGELATARLLTVAQTCRMHRRDPLEYLATAVSRHRLRQAVPTLIPGQ